MMNYLYVNGQGQDVWCRSHRIIKEAAFYGAGQVYDDVTQESYLALNLKLKFHFEVQFDPNFCDHRSSLMHNYCVCSD
jgi:hypothetical protein